MYQMGKRQSLPLVAGKFGYMQIKKNEMRRDPSLYHTRKLTLKWIKDLYIKPETVKLYRKTKGKKKTLNNIFVMTTKSQATTMTI